MATRFGVVEKCIGIPTKPVTSPATEFFPLWLCECPCHAGLQCSGLLLLYSLREKVPLKVSLIILGSGAQLSRVSKVLVERTDRQIGWALGLAALSSFPVSRSPQIKRGGKGRRGGQISEIYELWIEIQ